VHYKFNLPKAEQTERIIKAMHNPYFTILGHPTGRLLLEREPYEIDMEQIMKVAKRLGLVLELNSHPFRLDLNDVHCKMAKDLGVKVVISTDAHSAQDLGLIKFGIGQARRGWLTKKDVVNTLTLNQLRKNLRRIKK
jgi:DNA polymerase (family 10)